MTIKLEPKPHSQRCKCLLCRKVVTMIQVRDADIERIRRIKELAANSDCPTSLSLLEIEQLADEVLAGAKLLMQPRKDDNVG